MVKITYIRDPKVFQQRIECLRVKSPAIKNTNLHRLVFRVHTVVNWSKLWFSFLFLPIGTDPNLSLLADRLINFFMLPTPYFTATILQQRISYQNSTSSSFCWRTKDTLFHLKQTKLTKPKDHQIKARVKNKVWTKKARTKNKKTSK